MRYLYIGIVGLFLFTASRLHAGAPTFFMDGNQLLNLCAPIESASVTQEEYSKIEVCRSYIIGVLDGSSLIRAGNNSPRSHGLCLPDGNTVDQDVRIVLRYLKENPNTLHLTAAYHVSNSMHQAFACPK